MIANTSTPAVQGVPVNIGGGDWLAPGVTQGSPLTQDRTPRSLLVGVAGNVVGRLAADTADVTYPVIAGYNQLRFSVIRQAGTTATGLVALY